MESFTTTVELFGKTATGFRVPNEVVHALSNRKRPPVTVEVGGHTYRSTIAPYGDWFFLPLNAKNRAAAGVEAGDEVEVRIALDTEPRVVEVPGDLAVVLAKSSEARRTFDALSYSHQREYVEWINEAKRDETRARRIAKAVDMLAEGKTHR